MAHSGSNPTRSTFIRFSSSFTRVAFLLILYAGAFIDNSITRQDKNPLKRASRSAEIAHIHKQDTLATAEESPTLAGMEADPQTQTPAPKAMLSSLCLTVCWTSE